jgi:hypothetical protein
MSIIFHKIVSFTQLVFVKSLKRVKYQHLQVADPDEIPALHKLFLGLFHIESVDKRKLAENKKNKYLFISY